MPLTQGVHSEAGQVRRVMVHAPGREMERLTPVNREALLFDDMLWVKQARLDHMNFVDPLRERGGEVVSDAPGPADHRSDPKPGPRHRRASQDSLIGAFTPSSHLHSSQFLARKPASVRRQSQGAIRVMSREYPWFIKASVLVSRCKASIFCSDCYQEADSELPKPVAERNDYVDQFHLDHRQDEIRQSCLG